MGVLSRVLRRGADRTPRQIINFNKAGRGPIAAASRSDPARSPAYAVVNMAVAASGGVAIS